MNYFIKKIFTALINILLTLKYMTISINFKLNIHCMIESYLRYMEFERQFHLVGRHMQLILGNQTSISR